MLGAESPVGSRTLRQRVGGAWSVAWPTFFITAGLSLFALLLTEKGAVASSAPVIGWLLAWACAVGVLVVPLVILRRTFFRHRATQPLPVFVVVAKDVAFAAVYTSVLTAVAARLGLSLGVGFPEQLVSNMFLVAWWGPALAYFMDYRQQVRNARARLAADGRALEDLDRQQEGIVDYIRDEILAEVGEELDPVREHLEHVEAASRSATASQQPITREEWQRISLLLRVTAQDSVRTLSHRMWQRAEQRYDVPPWWMLPVSIVRHQPFRPIALALIDVLGTLGSNVNQYGGPRGAALVILGLCWSIPVMLVANALMRRHPSLHSAIFLAALALLQVIVVVRAFLRNLWIPGSGSLAWIGMQVVAVIVLVLVTSGFGAWRNREAAQIANLRAVVDEEGEVARERSAQIALLARDMAQYLHGSLQTRLIGCSLAMDQASETDDVPALERALSEALAALDTGSTSLTAVQSLRDEVSRKIDLWDGFCAFDVVIDERAGDSTDHAVVVGRVVEEAISNAIRHGHASRVAVAVSQVESGGLSVDILDDGRGPQGGSQGMGSAYLAMVSDGRWTMERSGSGTHVVVPIS